MQFRQCVSCEKLPNGSKSTSGKLMWVLNGGIRNNKIRSVVRMVHGKCNGCVGVFCFLFYSKEVFKWKNKVSLESRIFPCQVC
jgi:hypothetical protein